jgi:hypothetical protein
MGSADPAILPPAAIVEKLAPVHTSQGLSYLRLADLHVRLLFHFDVDALAVGGWKRVLRRG